MHFNERAGTFLLSFKSIANFITEIDIEFARWYWTLREFSRAKKRIFIRSSCAYDRTENIVHTDRRHPKMCISSILSGFSCCSHNAHHHHRNETPVLVVRFNRIGFRVRIRIEGRSQFVYRLYTMGVYKKVWRHQTHYSPARKSSIMSPMICRVVWNGW